MIAYWSHLSISESARPKAASRTRSTPTRKKETDRIMLFTHRRVALSLFMKQTHFAHTKTMKKCAELAHCLMRGKTQEKRHCYQFQVWYEENLVNRNKIIKRDREVERKCMCM